MKRSQDSAGGREACALCGGESRAWRRKRGYTIRLCESCGNAFVPGNSVPDDLEQLYSRGYFEGDEATGYPSYLADASLLTKNFGDRLDAITALSPPGRRLLEVGAAYGLFLKVAQERGWEASGVDIAEDCAERAARVSGAKVVAGDFSTMNLEGPFDVIAMFDVFEHLRQPQACLKRAYELLAPGGLVVIETCDHSALWARLLGNHWPFLDPPQHLFYFSETGLKELLIRTGFSPEARTEWLGRRVSFGNACFKLASELPEGRLRRRLKSWSQRGVAGGVYLNFHDAMLVAGRRIADGR
jgi:SAM-dependent methyltransferase